MSLGRLEALDAAAAADRHPLAAFVADLKRRATDLRRDYLDAPPEVRNHPDADYDEGVIDTLTLIAQQLEPLTGEAMPSLFVALRGANIARQAEWDAGRQIDLSYRGNELAGEVGEACNVIKKLERERLGIKGSRATREQLAEELADIVICVDLIALDAGIDMDVAVPAKFNATSAKVGLVTRMGATAQEGGAA